MLKGALIFALFVASAFAVVSSHPGVQSLSPTPEPLLLLQEEDTPIQNEETSGTIVEEEEQEDANEPTEFDVAEDQTEQAEEQAEETELLETSAPVIADDAELIAELDSEESVAAETLIDNVDSEEEGEVSLLEEEDEEEEEEEEEEDDAVLLELVDSATEAEEVTMADESEQVEMVSTEMVDDVAAVPKDATEEEGEVKTDGAVEPAVVGLYSESVEAEGELPQTEEPLFAEVNAETHPEEYQQTLELMHSVLVQIRADEGRAGDESEMSPEEFDKIQSVVPSLIEVTAVENANANTNTNTNTAAKTTAAATTATTADKPKKDDKKKGSTPRKLVKPVIIGAPKDRRPYIPAQNSGPKIEAVALPGAQWTNDVGKVVANVVAGGGAGVVIAPHPHQVDNNIYTSRVVYRDEPSAFAPARRFWSSRPQAQNRKYRYDIEYYCNWLARHGRCLSRTAAKKPKCATKLRKFWFLVKSDPTVTTDEWKILRRIVERQRIIDKLRNTFQPEYMDQYNRRQIRRNLKLTLQELEELQRIIRELPIVPRFQEAESSEKSVTPAVVKGFVAFEHAGSHHQLENELESLPTPAIVA